MKNTSLVVPSEKLEGMLRARAFCGSHGPSLAEIDRQAKKEKRELAAKYEGPPESQKKRKEK